MTLDLRGFIWVPYIRREPAERIVYLLFTTPLLLKFQAFLRTRGVRIRIEVKNLGHLLRLQLFFREIFQRLQKFPDEACPVGPVDNAMIIG